MTTSPCQHGVVGIGSRTLHALRTGLLRDLGEEAGAARLQELGYAAGEEFHQGFLAWLPTYAEVGDPGDLDAGALGEVLSAYFAALGWGGLDVRPQGRALVIRSDDWAEAEPSAAAGYPCCYVTTGILASFLTRLAGDHTLGVMEIACRTQGDDHCEFLVGSPDVLSAVYEAVAAGRHHDEVLSA
jgi:predicted hydrocarbon binding protein